MSETDCQISLTGELLDARPCEMYGGACGNDATHLAEFRWGAVSAEMKVCESCLDEENAADAIEQARTLSEKEVLEA